MFARFWSSAPLTRFESTAEFKNLAPHIALLKNKRNELKAAGDSLGVGSVDYKKYMRVNALQEAIDQEIDKFNQDNELSSKEFTKQLLSCIHKHVDGYEYTLNLPRNQYREYASNAITAVTYTTAGAAIVSGIGLVPSLFTWLVAAPKINDESKILLGLDKQQMSATLQIIDQLCEILREIGTDLGLAADWQKEFINQKPHEKAYEIPNEFICLITGGLMNDPVICVLDSQTYERAAVTKWLNEKGTSPYNREALGDKKIKDVLIPNIAIRDLIEKARMDMPTLNDQEHQQNTVSILKANKK
ncbi:MAG: hypothetical protein ACD_46C00685G0005 [uncultured bacterium]|nr:MAG: hypothetical protein ACD_46C00685G0005 [uncultured bacterium]